MKKKIAIICGGPSGERGISLNSARSIFDNLDRNKYELSLIYFNPNLKAYKITEAQIYSNTPMDFDFKLKSVGKALTKQELKLALQDVDLVFPVIHGIFGEDGQLQTMLEEFGVPYLGSGPQACRNTSDKHLCQQVLKQNGFHTVQDYILKKGDPLPELKSGKYVVKPLHGGSSLGVECFSSVQELEQKIKQVFKHESEAIIEPFCEGKEFTIIILENSNKEPVALFPTEIEFFGDKFFDYRKKYLASTETRYHTPARYDQSTIKKIQAAAEKAFKCLGMKDFARIDGWVLKDGTIWMNDVNAISGMEQNSFIFQSAAIFGLNHRQLLDYLINKKIDPENKIAQTGSQTVQESATVQRQELPIIFGGNTTERQVSVMSGTNVWIKLKSSQKYKPVPLFLTFEKKIYEIPHFLCLHHTTEEIEEKITQFKQPNFLENLKKLQEPILKRLKINPIDAAEKLFIPIQTSLEEIAKKYTFLFLGLHGGAGEDGTIQAKLDQLKLPYNGPGPKCSRLCMDKYLTGKKIDVAKIPGVKTAKKKLVELTKTPKEIWQELQSENFTENIILKPHADGCSAGVINTNSFDQFQKTLSFFTGNYTCIPGKAIHEGHGQIDLPKDKLAEILVEEYVFTDKITLKDLNINWHHVNDLIEVTIGVFGEKDNLEVFYPSQTIASQDILSLEEKFMGGTGINLTPPPQEYVNPQVIKKVQESIKKVGELLGIEGYSRIDTFMNIKTGDLTIIEANTLPGITASTVIFHQALAHTPQMTPLQFIEKIIEIGKHRFEK